MICTLTARRLKPGAYDAFREAWDPRDVAPQVIERWHPIHHVRDVDDPDVVISFGFFNGSQGELRDVQAEAGRGDQVAASRRRSRRYCSTEPTRWSSSLSDIRSYGRAEPQIETGGGTA